MIWLFALLCCIIIAVASAKMSLMPWKVSLPWIILWGVAGFFAAFLFAGMSQKQVFSLLNPANISTLEFIELMIMLCFIFSDGIVKRILGYYPGLMMVAPVAMISLLLIRLFPGMDFFLAGLISGCVISVVLAGLVAILRFVKSDSDMLYKTVLIAALLNIVIYGII